MIKSKTRTKSTGEVFTPAALVDEIINKIYETDPELFLSSDKIFLDPACGDGEFLRGVIRKLHTILGSKFTISRWKEAIQYQLLGVDLMWDNTCDTVYYLLRSWKSPQTKKQIAYNIISEYRGNETRRQVLQRIMDRANCTLKSAIPRYSWASYDENWILNNTVNAVPIVTTGFKDGFVLTDDHTPSEINDAFEQREYSDNNGLVIIRPLDNHYVEYSTNNGPWIPVENIVRANSLTEWDFENWSPKI